MAFSPSVEQIKPDEGAVQKALVSILRGIAQTTHRDYSHGTRSVHAKSYALLEGELVVLDDLPPTLAQGLFAQPNT